MFSPSLVTTPRRSPSPSKATPRSASRRLHHAGSGPRGCAARSDPDGGCGKVPSTSQYSGVTSAPIAVEHAAARSRRRRRCRQSTTTLSRRSICTSSAMRCDVVLADVAMLHAARRRRLVQAVFGDARVQVCDRVARQRFAADHDLEAVVVRRVVAAGHRRRRSRCAGGRRRSTPPASAPGRCR